jgi:hypothetical protein
MSAPGLTVTSDKTGVMLQSHGVIVSIPSAVIKLAFASIGTYISAKWGWDISPTLTLLGAILTAGSTASLVDSIHSSNEATRQAAANGALK